MAAAPPTGAPERARWPRLTGTPRGPLRALLPRGYAGFTEATTPRHLVLPATTSVALVVKLLDSAHRPPAFVMGGHGSSVAVEGDCAPSYLEVLLTPLGAYTLLGLPMEQLSGQTVDLVEVLGPDGRRLGEQLREAQGWRQRFGLLDRFLLGRLERGPRPSPEVGWVWQRLVATGGAVPIGRLAREVGWSHQHLIARFRQQVGLGPKTAGRLVRFEGVWGRLDRGRGGWSGGGWRPRPAMPTRRIWSVSSASSPAPPRPDSWPGPCAPVDAASRWYPAMVRRPSTGERPWPSRSPRCRRR